VCELWTVWARAARGGGQAGILPGQGSEGSGFGQTLTVTSRSVNEGAARDAPDGVEQSRLKHGKEFARLLEPREARFQVVRADPFDISHSSGSRECALQSRSES
jgi:hypothetical protein